MKNNSKFKRIIAGFLCAVLSLGALPMSAFAFTAEPGKTCEAFYGHKYTGSDGNTYHSPESYQAIHYDTAGNQTVRSHNGGGARATLWLRDDSGERQVMCIESGVDYGAYENYESVNGKNSAYFQNLPATAQYGIMLASIYGWAPDRAVPVSGCNEDDFSIATQTIYWEYQQLLRVSPASRTTNSFGIDKDTYYNGIKGRPAEKCYNWILEQMQRHATVPSFASNQKQSAQTYTLKYNPEKKNYSLTLTDTNNTLADINFTDSRISVSRSGNKYTFTSNTMIENAVGITAQKKIAQPMGKFLVWGNVGKQTMCSGAEDPVYFYFNIKTETTGIGHIIKHSEDGVVGGISFTISGNGVNKTVTTKDDGTVDIELMNKEYGDGANPVILKSEFIMSLCEQLIGGNNLGAKQKSIIDRCTASVYRTYQQNDYQGTVPTLQDFRDELLKQDEPEAKEIALAIELFTHGSLNTFAKPTNVDTNSYLICYDILDLGKQLMPIGMLVVLDSILNRITQNRAKGKKTFIFIDEIYLLFQHEYSANFLFTLWKRVRKYGAYASGITQNVDDLLQSHTARTMLANSEFIIMLNQAATDRIELAKLLNISDLQMSYITNVEAGHGLIKVGSSLVPFVNKFPTNTQLYKLMTTKPGEGV